MYLFLDNSQDQKIIFKYCLDTIWVQHEFASDGSVLSSLDRLLSQENKQLSTLRGLAVRVGVGKFTATRIATTMFNALAYTLQIPVLAVDDWSLDLLKKIQTVPIGQYVNARYSAPANIGGSKK